MNNSEIEIRIADLFAAVLKAAKAILCFALILALLGAGYGLHKAQGYVRTETGETEAVVKAKKLVETAEQQLSLAERALERYNEVEYPNAEKKYEHALMMVEQRQSYLDNSIYQSLDPFNCGVATLTFYIETAADPEANPSAPWLALDPRATIAMACTQVIAQDDRILEKVQEIMGTHTEIRFIKELVSVSKVSDQFVEIRAYNQDAKTAEKVVNYLYQTIIERLDGKVDPFTANVISQFTGYDVVWSINEKQISNEDKLLTAERALTDAETKRQTLLSDSKVKEDDVTSARNALKSANRDLRNVRFKTQYPALIYALIFLALGLVIGCFAAAFFAIVSSRLQNQSAVLSRYPFPILGVLPHGKKRWFAAKIRALEGDPETGRESAACVAAQNVMDVASGKKACLISTLGGGAAEEFAPYLNGKLAVCGDILRDPAAVKALVDFDSVVLVEERGSSRLDQIDGEVQQLKTLGKEILGIVLF